MTRVIPPDKDITGGMVRVKAGLLAHYYDDGSAMQVDSVFWLQDALENIGSAQDTRALAKNIITEASLGSDLQAHTASWWMNSLKQDSTTLPHSRLTELAHMASETALPFVRDGYLTELQAQLNNPTQCLSALRQAMPQLELPHKLAALTRSALTDNASVIAQSTPDVALLDMLRDSHTHILPELREATKAELKRVTLTELAHWHEAERRDAAPRALCTDLVDAYRTQLADLSQQSPRQAWEALDALKYRWQNGSPTIITLDEPVCTAVFNSFANAHPREASFEAGRQIKAGTSSGERRAALATTQAQASGLARDAQLLFLGELHARLMHEPELATPSRDKIIALYREQPDASPRAKLHELAQGDDVLRNTLWPPVVTLPPRGPSLAARWRHKLANLISH